MTRTYDTPVRQKHYRSPFSHPIDPFNIHAVWLIKPQYHLLQKKKYAAIVDQTNNMHKRMMGDKQKSYKQMLL